MERCVYDEVYKHLEENSYLSDLQAAYRPGNSTSCQLTDIYNQIMTAMDEGNEVLFTFCDVSKAFDRVNRAILFYKMP